MGFIFRKKLLPGITLNMSRRGPSLSGRIGPRGMGVSVNTRGRVTGAVGAGGLRYQKSKTLGKHTPRRTAAAPLTSPVKRAEDYLARVEADGADIDAAWVGDPEGFHTALTRHYINRPDADYDIVVMMDAVVQVMQDRTGVDLP